MSVNTPATAPWRDPGLSDDARLDALLATMTVREKVAQLFGVWVGVSPDDGEVAPHQHDFATLPVPWDQLIADGIGQLTRPFGTAPVDPVAGAASVAKAQRAILAAGRLGIPALVHEECLTGLAAWTAAVYPNPLCWGASFDPDLVERMGAQIGATMRRMGIHQGLAPVLDVTRDLRWGRVEETIGEDPLLVGTIAGAYVRGVQSAGVVATLKHFTGYSASRGGRNLAPVAAWAAGDRRRPPPAVRDGPAGRRGLGDEQLRRHRRRPRRRRRRAPDRPAAGHLRLHRHGRRRLLLRRLPADPAPRGGLAGRGRAPRAARRHRRRTAHRALLRRGTAGRTGRGRDR